MDDPTPTMAARHRTSVVAVSARPDYLLSEEPEVGLGSAIPSPAGEWQR